MDTYDNLGESSFVVESQAGGQNSSDARSKWIAGYAGRVAFLPEIRGPGFSRQNSSHKGTLFRRKCPMSFGASRHRQRRERSNPPGSKEWRPGAARAPLSVPAWSRLIRGCQTPGMSTSSPGPDSFFRFPGPVAAFLRRTQTGGTPPPAADLAAGTAAAKEYLARLVRPEYVTTPYRWPHDLDNWTGETWEIRRAYRSLLLKEPARQGRPQVQGRGRRLASPAGSARGRGLAPGPGRRGVRRLGHRPVPRRVAGGHPGGRGRGAHRRVQRVREGPRPGLRPGLAGVLGAGPAGPPGHPVRPAGRRPVQAGDRRPVHQDPGRGGVRPPGLRRLRVPVALGQPVRRLG